MIIKNKWISVKDQLPPDYNWVIVINEGFHGFECCWYEKKEFYINHKTAWKKVYLQYGSRAKPSHWLIPDRPDNLNYDISNDLTKRIEKLEELEKRIEKLENVK